MMSSLSHDLHSNTSSDLRLINPWFHASSSPHEVDDDFVPGSQNDLQSNPTKGD